MTVKKDFEKITQDLVKESVITGIEFSRNIVERFLGTTISPNDRVLYKEIITELNEGVEIVKGTSFFNS